MRILIITKSKEYDNCIKIIGSSFGVDCLMYGILFRRISRRFETIQKVKEDWIFATEEYDKETFLTMVFICLIVALLFAVIYLGFLCYKHNLFQSI